MMGIEMMKNEKKIVEVNNELKKVKKNAAQLKEYVGFNKKVFEEKECYLKGDVEQLTIKLEQVNNEVSKLQAKHRHKLMKSR